MRNLSLGLIAACLVLSSCQNNNAPDATTSSAQNIAAQTGIAYNADTVNTTISWRGTHKGGMAPRWGTLRLSEGVVYVSEGGVTSGSFSIDMETLKADSASVTEPGKKYTDLENHLKNEDFFNVTKYPKAIFEITSVSKYDSTQHSYAGATNMVSGNLKLKDSTVNITFPAKITINDSIVQMETSFNVDRSKWGLNYKTEGDPQNWLISKDITLGIRFVAKKK